jgi:N12 class adenine-specific DNA methylase
MNIIEVPDTLATALEEEARAEGISQAAILEKALKYYRRVMHQRRLEAALNWYITLPDQERSHFTDQFVAVYQNAVVDHDPDRLVLYKRVRERYGDQAVLIIPAEGPSEFSIISTQIEPK